MTPLMPSTQKSYAKHRFLLLCDQLHKLVEAGLETQEQRIEFIHLSLAVHAAKADVPKSYWRLANAHI